MSNFIFKVDAESEEFCLGIVSAMINHFKITEKEAVGRINRQWANNSFLGDDDIRYHEDEEFWAFDIYYGSDSIWWKKPAGLTPIPYP